jgi:hypothetical protein
MPGVAAAAVRIARTAPLNPADQGPDTPVTAPPWLLTRAGSALLGMVAAWPTLRAVYAGHVEASTFGAQVVVAAVMLGGLSHPRRPLRLTAPATVLPSLTDGALGAAQRRPSVCVTSGIV